MALDNAEFISELSIVDPPGTDPLNQGDDHIRTTKKAVQQSFPNVGSAVPQTGAQMAQMAIKNEVNLFTAENTFSSRTDFSSNIRFNGTPLSARSVQWHFNGSRTWELRGNDSTDNIEFVRYVGGIEQDTPLRIQNSDGQVVFPLQATFQFIAQFNSTAARFRSTNAGNTSGCLFISDIATLRWDFVRRSTNDGGDLVMQRYDGNGTFVDTPFTLSAITGRSIWSAQLLAPDGSQSAPGYSFQSNPSWGVFLGGDAMQFATAGISRMFIRSNGVVNIQNLPTTSAGLVTGDLWISSNFVAVIP